MELISAGFIAGVFGAGVLSFFTPCVLPLLPIYLGYLSDGPSRAGAPAKASLLKALAFTFGLSSAFFLLGFGAGAAGHYLNSQGFLLGSAIVVILMGAYQAGFISLPFLQTEKRLSVQFNPGKGLGGAFLLGFFFSFGWTPCIGPVLAAVLGVSSQQGSAIAGGWLLLVYALGLSLPFFILALGAEYLLEKTKGLYPHLGKIRRVGGILIMLMGVWLLYNQLPAVRAEHDLQHAAVAAPSEPAIPAALYGRTMPGFDRDGASLAQFRGKTVFIKFWATWCPACLAGLDDFALLAKEAASSPDTVIISIVAPGLHREVSREDFIEWARAQNLTFPIYFDEGGALGREFGVRAYPTGIYLDAKGIVGKKTVGDESNERIMDTIRAIQGK